GGLGGGGAERERVEGELEVARVPVHRARDVERLDAVEVERALDVADVLVEAGEVGVGVAARDADALLGEVLAERLDHLAGGVAGLGGALEPVLEEVVEVLVVDQNGGGARDGGLGHFGHGGNQAMASRASAERGASASSSRTVVWWLV